MKDRQRGAERPRREAVGRQYRIINPDATDAEVNEIANSDLGDEGIFTQAVSWQRSRVAPGHD